MVLTTIAYLNGLSALFLTLWGFLNFLRFFLLYLKEKKKLQPIVALLGLSLGAFSLGPSVSFFSLLLREENIHYVTYGLLSYTSQPITIIAAMYIGFEIFNKEKQKVVVGIYTFLGVIFWVTLFSWPSQVITAAPVESGELLDVSLSSIALIYAAVTLISLPIIISSGFLRLRRSVSDPEAERRAKYLVRGWIVFSLAAILETVLASQFAIIARIFMVPAFINIFAGFKPIKRKAQ